MRYYYYFDLAYLYVMLEIFSSSIYNDITFRQVYVHKDTIDIFLFWLCVFLQGYVLYELFSETYRRYLIVSFLLLFLLPDKIILSLVDKLEVDINYS